MRVLVDLRSHLAGTPLITQVERGIPLGQAGKTNINGRFALPLPRGVDFSIDGSSYVLDGGGDIDGKDVTSIAYAHLLARYPQYKHVYVNPLLTPAQVGQLDFTKQFRDTFTNPPNVYLYAPRVQTGRPNVGAPIAGDAGCMPTHTALLPLNAHATVPRPGVLVTKEIDVGAYTGGQGADNFLVHWVLHGFTVGDDVNHGDTNQPAMRGFYEPDLEPDDFKVYLSTDDGTSWCHTALNDGVGFCDKATKIRLAMVNRSNSKVYVGSYGVLF